MNGHQYWCESVSVVRQGQPCNCICGTCGATKGADRAHTAAECVKALQTELNEARAELGEFRSNIRAMDCCWHCAVITEWVHRGGKNFCTKCGRGYDSAGAEHDTE